MTTLLVTNLIKLRHRRMPWILIVILLLIVGIVLWASSNSPLLRALLVPPRSMLVALTFASIFASFLWPVLAGSWAGSEFSWGTVKLVLTRRPDRIAFVLAGLLTVFAVILAALLLVVLVGLVGGAMIATLTSVHSGGPADSLPAVFLAAWYVSAFWATIAYSIATLFRSTAAGISVGVGLYVANTIVSPIFSGLGGAWKTVAQHLPAEYTNSLVGQIARSDLNGKFTSTPPGSPGIAGSIIGIAIYGGIVLAAALWAITHQDVNA